MMVVNGPHRPIMPHVVARNTIGLLFYWVVGLGQVDLLNMAAGPGPTAMRFRRRFGPTRRNHPTARCRHPGEVISSRPSTCLYGEGGGALSTRCGGVPDGPGFAAGWLPRVAAASLVSTRSVAPPPSGWTHRPTGPPHDVRPRPLAGPTCQFNLQPCKCNHKLSLSL